MLTQRSDRARRVEMAAAPSLDRLADAVHERAVWLPPWPPPAHLVVVAGYRLSTRPGAARPRCVARAWHPDPQQRGLATLRAFAAMLLDDVLGLARPDSDVVERLAGRLLIPAPMLRTARRHPTLPGQHAPRWFVAGRIAEGFAAVSGTYRAAKVR